MEPAKAPLPPGLEKRKTHRSGKEQTAIEEEDKEPIVKESRSRKAKSELPTTRHEESKM